jgi:hypothetical protein
MAKLWKQRQFDLAADLVVDLVVGLVARRAGISGLPLGSPLASFAHNLLLLIRTTLFALVPHAPLRDSMRGNYIQ